MKTIGWISFAFFALAIGLYPFIYWVAEVPGGLLSSKPAELLHNNMWRMFFYAHISFGGVALLTGWSQFTRASQTTRLRWHRRQGKAYVMSSLASGLAGFCLSFYATGGVVAAAGFGSLAVCWLTSTSLAFRFIRKKQIDRHQQWMIRSYALCFAAVTLRLWIPFSQAVLHMEFITAYRIIAWLCWIPNWLLAEWLVARNAAITPRSYD